MAWRLRKATLRDLPVLVRHRDAMWAEMGRVAPGEDDPTSGAYRDWLAARMRKGTLTAFIAEAGPARRRSAAPSARSAPATPSAPPKALASGGVWIQEVQPRPGHPLTMWGYVLSVYTEPEARRQGIARAVLQACLGHARDVGCTRATLHASEAGRPLYRQIGFEATAEMWVDLRPPHRRPRRRAPDPPEGGPEPPSEPPIEIADLDSEALRRVRYHPARGWLDVTFADGPEYRYFGVGPDGFLGLVQAESRGTYVNQRIKPAHTYRRLRRTGPSAPARKVVGGRKPARPKAERSSGG